MMVLMGTSIMSWKGTAVEMGTVVLMGTKKVSLKGTVMEIANC